MRKTVAEATQLSFQAQLEICFSPFPGEKQVPRRSAPRNDKGEAWRRIFSWLAPIPIFAVSDAVLYGKLVRR
jgi:hypothetical protein